MVQYGVPPSHMTLATHPRRAPQDKIVAVNQIGTDHTLNDYRDRIKW